MKPFKSYSQAAQDRFVHAVLVQPENLLNGRFLDIGACHPVELSNTYALEQLGWRGFLYDIDPGAIRLCQQQRKSHAVLADVTKLDWANELRPWVEEKGPIDYLSLDVDAASTDALRGVLAAEVPFRVITLEHDAYRFGDGPRSEMRRMLYQRGYDLVCEDVCSTDGLPYEDWWANPALVPAKQYDRFRSVGKKWTEIFPL